MSVHGPALPDDPLDMLYDDFAGAFSSNKRDGQSRSDQGRDEEVEPTVDRHAS